MNYASRTYSHLILSIRIIVVAISLTCAASHKCRCLPSDSCWPDPDEWDTLNQTKNRNFLELRPVGSVCHGAECDEAECELVRNLTHNPLWRISQPADYQWTNWESRGLG
ncbi:hypothetical protein BJY01DRAFT_219394 [Aspergillus pseudoustus]|uniref:Uncharacterized protein n=1 Tax=Aspergillus pseudoustus TaxID=1810923 RepID=A0ABR4JJB3_9EURO